MSERDFEFRGKKFKLNKIDAMKQFHIVRRIGPILAELLPAIKDAARFRKKELSQDEQLEAIAKFASPVMNGLSKLSNEDSEAVLYGLLASVEVQQASGNWAFVAHGSMLAMQDLELPVLLQAASRAFMYNLSGFFAALPQ